MVNEGHVVALGGDSRITDPAAAGLVENFANGIFQAVAATYVVYDG